MTWKIDIYTGLAGHSESQTTFKWRREGKHNLKVSLIPSPGKTLPWTGTALEEVEKEFQEAFEAEWAKERRRLRFQNLLQTKLHDNKVLAARVISTTSGRNVSPRSVQAWQIELNCQSSRPCPQWALEALEAYVPPSMPAQIAIDASVERNRWVLHQTDVELATHKLESEEKRRKRWQKVPLPEFPKSIADLEGSFRDHLAYLDGKVSVLINTLIASEEIPQEFKARLKEGLERISTNTWAVHTAAEAIREGREEFSNPDGLPESNEGEAGTGADGK